MTEDLEDGDQGDADGADMNTVGAVWEEPVITIGIGGEKLDECESDEESHVDGVNGVLPGSRVGLEISRCRCTVLSHLVSAFLKK